MGKVFEGEDFIATISEETRTALDQTFTKAFLEKLQTDGLITVEQYRTCFSDSITTVVRTVRKDKSKKPAFVMPTLANMTDSGLADELGKEGEKEAEAKKYKGVYREGLLARSTSSTPDTTTPPTTLPSEAGVGLDGQAMTDE